MATTHKYKPLPTKKWTYGAELEFVDWPRLEPLPVKGMAIDDGNYTSVNNNGIAVDGKGKTYHLGGEILTAPTEDPTGQTDQMATLQKRWPSLTHNYRTGLNVHVRVPGLSENVGKLVRLQKFIHKVMPALLPIIDPIPRPKNNGSKGEKRCYKVRLKDHHSLLPAWRVELQSKAKTPKEFFEAEAVHPKTGGVHWALVARACVNLRQMLQTDTVEFRHLFMPATLEEMNNSVLWAKLFMEAALYGDNVSADELLEMFDFKNKEWPKPLPYDPWLDKGFFFTSPHYHPKDVVAKHISEWLTKYPKGRDSNG